MHGPPAPLSTASIVRRYYGVWLTYSLAGGFLAGVYPLFLRSRGLDQFEINSVLAVYFAVTFLLDVPTSAFADAIGRRLAFVLGCALRCLAFGLYFVSHVYVLFLVAETVDAVGTTFCNGGIGYVADLRGIPFAWKLAGTLSLVAVPCYLALRPRPSLTAPERTLP